MNWGGLGGAALGIALRNNPFYRAYEIGDLGWNVIQRIKTGPQVWVVPGEYNLCCGSPTGNDVVRQSISSCSPFVAGLCGLTGQALTDQPTGRGLIFGDRYEVTPGVTRVTIRGVYASPLPGLKPLPVSHPTIVWGNIGMMPAARPQVFRPVDTAVDAPAPAGVGGDMIGGYAPAGRRVKERKGRAQKVVAIAAKYAFEATEMTDLIDNLYDALPKEIRDNVVPTGKLSSTARLYPGKYVTAFDKAMALYRSWNKLNVPDAVRNVIINHFEDKIIGGLSRNQQAQFKKMGFTQRGGPIGS